MVEPTSYTVNENSGQIGVIVKLTRDTNNNEVTDTFGTANGAAAQGSDYFAANGTLVFAPNETVKLVQVAIINDFIAEAAENFFLNLSNPVNATVTASQATINILDDDGSADGINIVEFSSADYGTVETLGFGQPDASITFVLNAQRRGDPNQEIDVELYIGQTGDTAVHGDADNDADYQAPSSQIVRFPPGINQVLVSVPVFNRDGAQGNRFFTANLVSNDPLTSIGQPLPLKLSAWEILPIRF